MCSAAFNQCFAHENLFSQRNARRFSVVPEGPLGVLVGLKPEHKEYVKAIDESLNIRWKNFLGT